MFATSTLTGPGRKGWVKVTLILLFLAVSVGGLVAWRTVSAKKEEKKPDTANAVKTLEFAPGDIAELKPTQLGQVIPISGSVRPLLQATVKSKVPAEVARVHVQEGEQVAAGQVLVSLDTADLKARSDTQQAAVAEARARLDLARKNQDNNKTLLTKGFISQNAYDSVANNLTVAEAALKSALAQAAIAERALADANIRAPFNGIVAKRWVNTGDKVAGDTPVAAIVDLARMELEAQVPVAEIPYVKVGQEVAFKVDGFTGRNFTGKVDRINPAADIGSRSIAIFVSLPNKDASLKGGMFANGRLAVEGKAAVNALPVAAIREEGGQSFVFAIKDGKLERKPVTIGLRSMEKGMVEVREGLAEGAQVVAVKADGLKAGTIAVIKKPGETKPAATPVKEQEKKA
ncbi:MAG: efflux RND transporter periplasmic adaptor subunit [Betaproteobacteria bacterium]|nr:efflux RND transporter periplasmic adaptor subunit [Betaproteobacteria bacterium]